MHQVFLGIGGNIGNKQTNFDKVYTHITNWLGIIVESSSIYESAPWGFEANDMFWNQVLKIETPLLPFEILQKIGEIEKAFGRKREVKGYSSREMDIDILYFDDLVVEHKNLTIPHPQIANRLFVLIPLAEIAPDFIHPALKLKSVEMLSVCADKSEVRKVEL